MWPDETYKLLWTAGLVFAGLTAVGAGLLRTPYGRFSDRRFGPGLDPRWGWLLMELPAIPAFAWFYLQGPRAFEPLPLVFAGIWLLHYANRGFAFPLLQRVRPGSRMSWLVVISGAGVCCLHGYLYGAWLPAAGTPLTAAWLAEPRFWAGLGLYGLGLGLNLHSDALLRRLRRARRVDDAGAYRIPRGGAFRWVSCPHYLGELLAWAGLLLASACPGGWFILAVSAANLVPRALATHRWYRAHFSDYPPERRALLPYIL